MRIRRAKVADIPAMMEVEPDSRGSAHWSRPQYEKLLAADEGSQSSERLAWVVEDDAAQSEVGSGTAPEIPAFLIAHRVDQDWELENIVVAGTSRRRGIGSGLLNELVTQARSQQGKCIFLEVRESNQAARVLYRRAGFEEVGLRKGYYSDPPEDAILCRLSCY